MASNNPISRAQSTGIALQLHHSAIQCCLLEVDELHVEREGGVLRDDGRVAVGACSKRARMHGWVRGKMDASIGGRRVLGSQSSSIRRSPGRDGWVENAHHRRHPSSASNTIIIATLTVCVVRRARKHCPLALLHGRDACVPPLDHLSHADLELRTVGVTQVNVVVVEETWASG